VTLQPAQRPAWAERNASTGKALGSGRAQARRDSRGFAHFCAPFSRLIVSAHRRAAIRPPPPRRFRAAAISSAPPGSGRHRGSAPPSLRGKAASPSRTDFLAAGAANDQPRRPVRLPLSDQASTPSDQRLPTQSLQRWHGQAPRGPRAPSPKGGGGPLFPPPQGQHGRPRERSSNLLLSAPMRPSTAAAAESKGPNNAQASPSAGKKARPIHTNQQRATHCLPLPQMHVLF